MLTEFACTLAVVVTNEAAHGNQALPPPSKYMGIFFFFLNSNGNAGMPITFGNCVHYCRGHDKEGGHALRVFLT